MAGNRGEGIYRYRLLRPRWGHFRVRGGAEPKNVLRQSVVGVIQGVLTARQRGKQNTLLWFRNDVRVKWIG